MNSGDTEWSALSLGDGEDSVLNSLRKTDVSTASVKSEVFEESNQGEDELINTLGLYDGYDSYNENGSSSDNDDLDTSLLEEDIFIPDDYKHSYQTDRKDGMATCEHCGSVGVKHAFYSKSKRFCSLSCSKSFTFNHRDGKAHDTKASPPSAGRKGKPGAKKMNQKNQSLLHSSYRGEMTHIFDWGPYLANSSVTAAPVYCFSHVPMHDSWDQMVEGVLVEVNNTDLDIPRNVKVYWMATVLKICGYKVLLRYEGFGSDSSKDFWGNVLSEDIHNVGWCATYGKMLAPPRTIRDKYVDWKEFLIKRLTGTRTIPPHLYAKTQEWLRGHSLQLGMVLEVVDKMCVSAMRVAVIKEMVGCRLRLNYVDSKEEDEFWCHMTSPLIHPVGWSQLVGHKLHASHEYMNSCLNKIAAQSFAVNDVTSDMLLKCKDPPYGAGFQVGMKLEAIDPLNLSAICVATVTKVLRNNFLMIGIDGSMAENGSDWFCYHATSPSIFPVGFCEINHLELTPPRGTKPPFKWFDYLKQTKSMAAPVKFFDKEIPKHGFRPGMKVEAVDLMEPRLICVATVTKVVGRLLRIHFDGWENNYDQWVDCHSPDIFPVGWCHVMKHGLEGPRSRFDSSMLNNQLPAATVHPRKRKGKTPVYRGPRKKRNTGPDKRTGLQSSPPSTPPHHTKQSPSPSKSPSAASSSAFKGSFSALSSSPSSHHHHRHLSSFTTNESFALPTSFATPSSSSLISAISTTTSNTANVNASSPAFPPHKVLSSEVVAANLPPLLEPDMGNGSFLSSYNKGAEVTGQSVDKKPPNLSPHKNLPEGFSLELAQRLKANTYASSLSSFKDGEKLLEKSVKQGLVPQTTSLPMNRSTMESKSNLIVSSTPNKASSVDEAFYDPGMDGNGTGGVIVLTLSSELRALHLSKWSLSDMVDVLKVNGCGAYTNVFVKKNIDGPTLLGTTMEGLTKLMSSLDGPLMRLCDLIQQVKACSAALEKSSRPSSS